MQDPLPECKEQLIFVRVHENTSLIFYGLYYFNNAAVRTDNTLLRALTILGYSYWVSDLLPVGPLSTRKQLNLPGTSCRGGRCGWGIKKGRIPGVWFSWQISVRIEWLYCSKVLNIFKMTGHLKLYMVFKKHSSKINWYLLNCEIH